MKLCGVLPYITAENLPQNLQNLTHTEADRMPFRNILDIVPHRQYYRHHTQILNVWCKNTQQTSNN